jgi:hypothetical protein
MMVGGAATFNGVVLEFVKPILTDNATRLIGITNIDPFVRYHA